MKFLRWLNLIVVFTFLSACGTGGGGVGFFPTDTALPPPVINVTAAPDPNIAVKAYLDAFKADDVFGRARSIDLAVGQPPDEVPAHELLDGRVDFRRADVVAAGQGRVPRQPPAGLVVHECGRKPVGQYAHGRSSELRLVLCWSTWPPGPLTPITTHAAGHGASSTRSLGHGRVRLAR